MGPIALSMLQVSGRSLAPSPPTRITAFITALPAPNTIPTVKTILHPDSGISKLSAAPADANQLSIPK